MLRQQLPRTAAAASLITAPLLGLVAACAWPPLRAGDRAQIAAISAQPGRWYIFSLFILLSTIMLVPAVLALMRLLGRSRPAWALIAGCAGPARHPHRHRRRGHRAHGLADGRTVAPASARWPRWPPATTPRPARR